MKGLGIRWWGWLVLMLALVGCAGDSTAVRRLHYLPRRIETELRRLRPHPNFVPTPAFAADDTAPGAISTLNLQSPTSNPQSPTPNPQSPTPSRTPVPYFQVVRTATPARASPTVTRTPTPLPTATSTPTPTLPPTVLLSGFTHAWQTWNNCGPATLAMNLSHLGRSETQADAAAVLKPDADDKNVSPHEMVAYARSLGLEAVYRVGGDLETLKRLLSHGVPVIAETWIEPKPNDGMGHYRLLIGYDDAAGEFVFFDSYFGPNVRLSYAEFDAEWRVFNRTYLIVYTPDQGAAVREILGRALDDTWMYAQALGTARAEVAANPKDPFAWFNLGTNLTALRRYDEAALAYDQARRLGLPWRMLWYQFGPFEAYFAVGRYEDVLTLAAANLRNAGNLEESHYWRGRALQALGRVDEARQAFERALHFNPNYTAAREAVAALDTR